jgi:hypothetical protein
LGENCELLNEVRAARMAPAESVRKFASQSGAT